MGFGHRVYKNYDPRAKVIKSACDEVLDRMGIHSPLLEIAKELEEITLKDDYFVERKLYPNVDFYSGVIYNAIGTPATDVHGDVRDRAAAGLDRAVEGAPRGSRLQDRATAPGLYGPDRRRTYTPIDKR